MKINKLFLVSLLLLTVITIGAVSAADTLQDDSDEALSLDEDANLQISDENIIKADEKKDLKDWTVSNKKEITNYTDAIIDYNGEFYYEDPDEEEQVIPLQLLVDGKERTIHDYTMDYISFDTSGLALGEHSYVLNFLGNKFYNPTNASGTFTVKEIAVNADEKYTINGLDSKGYVDITIPTTITGVISVIVDGEEQTKDIEFDDYDLETGYGYFSFWLGKYNVACGENEIIVKINDETIRTYKIHTDYIIYVDDDNVKYGNSKYFVDLPIGMDPELATITIDGKKQDTTYEEKGDGLYNGARILYVNTTKDLTVGNHSVEFTYAGDEMFTKETFKGIIGVNPWIEVPWNAIREDNFTLTMPDDCDEDLELYIKYLDDEEPKPFLYKTVKASGDVVIPLANFTKPGSYFYDFRPLKGYRIYNDSPYFTLNPDIAYPKEHVIGADDTISIDLANNHTGTLTLYDDDHVEICEVKLVNGKASISLSTAVISEGKQELNVKLDEVYAVDDDGYEYENSYDYYLKINIVKPQITLPADKIILGENANVSIDLKGFNGTLIVREDVKEGEGAAMDLVNGKATVPVVKLTEGKKSYYAHLILNRLDIEGNITSVDYTYNFDVEVVNPITAKDASPLYSANEKYSVKVNGNGKVTFYILDGKKQILKKSVNIKNGAATLTYKITQGVKTYTIKTVFNKASVTKKLTVKHVVTLKTIKVKKSAKKITLQANLAKVNKQYLVKKTVTFKFNGKTYKAKTDKKGVAKVTIKNTAYKNVKVGKKITYQATYLKDTVKKTVKVLK